MPSRCTPPRAPSNTDVQNLSLKKQENQAILRAPPHGNTDTVPHHMVTQTLCLITWQHWHGASTHSNTGTVLNTLQHKCCVSSHGSSRRVTQHISVVPHHMAIQVQYALHEFTHNRHGLESSPHSRFHCTAPDWGISSAVCTIRNRLLSNQPRTENAVCCPDYVLTCLIQFSQ